MKKAIIFSVFILSAIILAAQPSADLELSVPDVMPKFRGGETEMFIFINERMNFSDEDTVNHIAGELIMTFVVDTSGIISDLEIKKGVSTKIDSEIKRIFQTMPAWIPGRVNRQNVNCRFSLAMIINAEHGKVQPVFR